MVTDIYGTWARERGVPVAGRVPASQQRALLAKRANGCLGALRPAGQGGAPRSAPSAALRRLGSAGRAPRRVQSLWGPGASPGRDRLRAGIGVRRAFLLPSPVWVGMGGRLWGAGVRMRPCSTGRAAGRSSHPQDCAAIVNVAHTALEQEWVCACWRPKG